MKRFTTIFIVLLFALLVLFFAPVEQVNASTAQLKDLPIGAVVYDPASSWEHRTENDYTGAGENKPVKWILVAKNHYTTDPDVSAVTLIGKEVVAKYAFDNQGGAMSTNWGNSNQLRPWLNGPFLNHLSREFKDNILTTTVPNFDWASKTTYSTYDKVFIPARVEMGFSSDHTEGVDWGFFNFESYNRPAQLAGKEQSYWTRSPSYGGSAALYYVTALGGIGGRAGRFMHQSDGVRPVINMRADAFVKTTDQTMWLSSPQAQPEVQQDPQPEPEVSPPPAQASPVMMQGQIVQGRFLVPMRSIFEALGAEVYWDAATSTVTGVKGDISVKLTINSKQAIVNGVTTDLEVPPMIFSGRTFVPLRFISESLGADAKWDGAKKMATITQSGTTIKVFELAVKDFKLDHEGTIYLSVGERKEIKAIITGQNLSYDEQNPRWGTSDVSVLTVSGSVVSGWSSTWGGVTERFIITADQAVSITGRSPGQVTLSASVGPYEEGRSQTRQLTVIVR